MTAERKKLGGGRWRKKLRTKNGYVRRNLEDIQSIQEEAPSDVSMADIPR